MDSPAHVKRSYEICLDSCMGVLESIIDFGGQLNTLLHIPDSLFLLADHATMLAVYLLLVPAVTADQDAASHSKTTIEQVSNHVAQDCVNRIKRVKEITGSASLLRPGLVTALALSADYLDSIIVLIEGRATDHEAVFTINSAAGIHTNELDLGWDWLQYFLTAPLV